MQAKNRIGKQTFKIPNDVSIINHAVVAGQKEFEGPLGKHFDVIMEDNYYGEKTWEKAEAKMQKTAANIALQKAGYRTGDIEIIFAGDLLNQCVGTNYGLRDLNIPFYGLYGACSTMAESLSLGAMAVGGDFASRVMCGASSHFCSSERQFRTPLAYGGQRPPTAQTTVTAAAMTILEQGGTGPYLTCVTTGKIIDKGICDANNMGAAMAPAAADTLLAHFTDTKTTPKDYDLILTGDLGQLGWEIVCDLMKENGIKMESYDDCGRMIYFTDSQDVHCGGSGCGCSAAVLCGYILPKIQSGEIEKLLFLGTGALMSPTSTQQGESIPSIAHCVTISHKRSE